jgi:tetratricopeptide (TPR) repeat protein
MLQFSNSPYGAVAEWDQKRLAHRMKIFKLMQEPNQAATDSAIETMITDLKDRPELSGELYWIACGYEEQPDKSSQAKQMYRRIVSEYPASIEAGNSALDIRRLEIWDTVNANDVNASQISIDKFVEDFKQHPYAGDCFGRVLIKDYMKGMELKKNNQQDKAEQYFTEADYVWQRLLSNKLQDGSDAVYLYYYAACNCQQLKQWDNAITYYQKVVDNWPEFEYACGAQAGVGWCYEALRSTGAIPKEQADPIIEQIYISVLDNYPNCYISHYAAFQLAEMNAEKGNKVNAITYYRKFLELAKPGNSRTEEVKIKLAKLGGATK